MSIYGGALDGVSTFTKFSAGRVAQVKSLSDQVLNGGTIQGSEDYQKLSARLNIISDDLEFANGILGIITKNITQLNI